MLRCQTVFFSNSSKPKPKPKPKNPDMLIRPIFDKNVRSTTIIDGVDLIRRLETYAYTGYLKSTTLFCTIDITDLYTMLLQEELLNILMEFVSYYGYQKVKGIPLY